MNVDVIINEQIGLAHKALGKKLSAEVIFMRTPLVSGTDDHIRRCIEDIQLHTRELTRLCVVLETNGGYIEVVERIHNVFRRHYKEVVFVIPNFAYSAGTVLALSGDEIYMDYYSVLGPIDPQIVTNDGSSEVPGIGYLVKFDQLLKKINADLTGEQTRAEIALLINKFDPASLFFIEQARDHAIELLKEWLPKYKFKDWEITEQEETPVTPEMKQKRAREIAEVLGNPERWHSHGRGISIRELTGEEIKLKIKDFSDDSDLNNTIRTYYNLIMDYCAKNAWQYFIHSQLGLRRP